MGFNNGQHIPANNGSISVPRSMVGFFGDEFVVKLCVRDSTRQSIGSLIQERHAQGLQVPHRSREVVATENIYDGSGISNTWVG